MTYMRLKYVTKINARSLPESTDPTFQFRYIDIGSVDGNGKIEIPKEVVFFGGAPSRARRLARPGDTIVSTVRTYLRAVARVPNSEDSLVFSTGFSVLAADSSVDSRYLSYSCLSDEFIDEVVARSVGVSYPAVNANDVGNIPIRVPNLTEQRRIAEFLDVEAGRIDYVLRVRLRQLGLLEERTRVVVDHEIDRLVSKWGLVPFRRIIRKIEQGSSPQCEAVPAGVGEWGVLKLSSIKHGKFHPSENKKLPEDVEADVRFRLSSGDLLVTRANTPNLVGDAAVVKEGSDNILLSDLVYRVVLGEGVDSNYLCAVIRGSRVRGLIQAAARGSSQSMVKLRGEDIRSWGIPAANDQEQMDFVKRVKVWQDEVDTIRLKIERQVTLLKERKQALITAAVTGQIDVTTARGADLS